MSDSSLATVRRLLIDGYDEIKRRLTKRLGSPDLAGDALHDAWIRIERAGDLGGVRNPGNYIFGVAMNAAADRMRVAEARYVSPTEIEAILHIPDEAPDSERVAVARSELRQLEAILRELPPRQRAILLAARLDNTPRLEIARKLNISLRLVEQELRAGQEYCLARRKQGSK